MAVDNIDKLDNLNEGRVKLNEAIDQANTVQGQLDTIIIDSGTSDAEVIQARGGEPLLYNRLDKVDTQLAENMQQIKSTKFGRGTKRPLITFIDDDAGIAPIFTKLKPLYDSKGIVGVSAVNGDPTSKATDLLTLQNSGWEISSHSFAHTDLMLMSESQLRADFETSLSLLRGNGLNVENLVYPYGTSNALVRKVAKDYFNCGARVGGGINKYPFNQFNLNRVALGSSFDSGSPIAGLATNSLEYYKYRVDEAIENNCWLIFMTHANDIDDTQLQYISDLIDYIQSLNVDVVTLKKGVELIGNIIENGDAVAKNDYLTVDCEGKVYSSSIFNSVKNASTNSSVFTTPITEFDLGRITVTPISDTNASGLPENKAGILITNNILGENGYPYQEYHVYNSPRVYTRGQKVDGTWTTFYMNTQQLPFASGSLIAGDIGANSTSERTIAVVGAEIWDFPIINIPAGVESGLIVSAYILGADIVTIKIHNIKTTPVTFTTKTCRVTVIKPI